MKIKRCLLNRILFVLVVISFFSARGQAETVNCTAITYLPYTISTQGIYCLKGNLATNMTAVSAIEIAANNVVIDLNGFKLGGLAAGPGTSSTGISALQRTNITIRNGTVRGFARGIWLVDDLPYTTSQGHLIENVRADMNTSVGIWVMGQGNMVRNNQVVDTGGSTVGFVTGGTGILVYGPGNKIISNDVYETKYLSAEYGNGIAIDSGHSSVIENNRIGNMAVNPIHPGAGIYVIDSQNVLVSNNRITTTDWGIWIVAGSSAKYRDTLTSNVTTPYSGGTDAGNNN